MSNGPERSGMACSRWIDWYDMLSVVFLEMLLSVTPASSIVCSEFSRCEFSRLYTFAVIPGAVHNVSLENEVNRIPPSYQGRSRWRHFGPPRFWQCCRSLPAPTRCDSKRAVDPEDRMPSATKQAHALPPLLSFAHSLLEEIPRTETHGHDRFRSCTDPLKVICIVGSVHQLAPLRGVDVTIPLQFVQLSEYGRSEFVPKSPRAEDRTWLCGMT